MTLPEDIHPLNFSSIATFIVDRNLSPLYRNDCGEALLKRGDALRLVHGRLSARDKAITQRLNEVVISIAERCTYDKGSPNSWFAIPRANRLPLTLLAIPFRLGTRLAPVTQERAVILLIQDPDMPAVAIPALQQLFGLTPREAKIAGGLAEGKSVDDIAAAQGISHHTTRSHLKSIFLKTGTNRQTQLVSVLLRSLAPLNAADLLV